MSRSKAALALIPALALAACQAPTAVTTTAPAPTVTQTTAATAANPTTAATTVASPTTATTTATSTAAGSATSKATTSSAPAPASGTDGRAVLTVAGLAFTHPLDVKTETDDDSLSFDVASDRDDDLEIELDDKSGHDMEGNDDEIRIVRVEETSLAADGQVGKAFVVQLVHRDDDDANDWESVTLLTNNPALTKVGTVGAELDDVQVHLPGTDRAVEGAYDPDDDDLTHEAAIARLDQPDHKLAHQILRSVTKA